MARLVGGFGVAGVSRRGSAAGWWCRWWWVWVAALVLVGVGLVAGLWPSSGRVLPPARARGSVDFTVCVLTDARGVAGADAAVVWRGVLAAQGSTNLRAQSLPAVGDGSVDAAVVGLDTLAARGCGLIVAVGEAQVRAVWRQAGVFSAAHFVVVAGPAGVAANVAVVEGEPGVVAARVEALAREGVAGRFRVGVVS